MRILLADFAVDVAVATEPSAVKLLTKDREKLGYVSDVAVMFSIGTYEPCLVPFRDSIWRLGAVAVIPVTLPTMTSATVFPARAICTHLLTLLVLDLTRRTHLTVDVREHWYIWARI